MLRKLFGIILIGMGVLFLIGNIISLDVLGKWWHGPSESIRDKKSLDVKGVKRIQVESDIASIQVSPSQDQHIYAILEGQMEAERKENIVYKVEKQGDLVEVKLRIEANGSPFSFPDFGSNHVELSLSLPKQLYDEVTIETNIGKIDIDQLEAKQLQVETDVGKVSVDRFQGEKASINSDIGLIQVEKSKSAFDLTTHTGKVDMNLDSIEHDIYIASDTGKVEVISMKAPESLNLRLRSDVGGVTAKVPGLTMEEQTEHELSGRIGNGSPIVDIRTDVGKVNFLVHQ